MGLSRWIADLMHDEKEVWVTGIGLVSSIGEGIEEHWNQLSSHAEPKPVLNTENFKPYQVHQLVDLDFSAQIPRRGDQRQMGQWQRLGVYAAGLALSDAGIAGSACYTEKTNIIVAAGCGERDINADEAILDAYTAAEECDGTLNRALQAELRPTLFLSQLPNLMAGNISIVHRVTGSSRTFIGSVMSGVSAIQVAVDKIRTGQEELFLVGGAYVAERPDMLLEHVLNGRLWTNDFESVWERETDGGGMVTGSVGAFLVLEAKDHAIAREASSYARISDIQSNRLSGKSHSPSLNAELQFDAIRAGIKGASLGILSGASGVESVTTEERAFLEGLQQKGYETAIRAFGTMLGHSEAASFAAGIALASIALWKEGFYLPFDRSGIEYSLSEKIDTTLVTAWGPTIGQGLALVERIPQHA